MRTMKSPMLSLNVGGEKNIKLKKAQGTVGFGARDFAHGANAATPKQLSLLSVIISKIRFLRETKMSLKS